MPMPMRRMARATTTPITSSQCFVNREEPNGDIIKAAYIMICTKGIAEHPDKASPDDDSLM